MKEVKLLERANSMQTSYSKHIIRLEDHFRFREHLCMVFDLQNGGNLYEYLKKTKMLGVESIEFL